MTYIAMGTLSAPGTLVAGYRRGDEVPDSVIENWGLVVGQDVAEDELPGDDTPAPLARPTEESTRADWEAWAVANGMSAKDAAEASQEDLEAVGPAEPETYERPADSARKGDWVLYVNNHPQATVEDQAWAGDDTTTKADLQAWKPAHPGDTVAVAATEQANG